MNNKYSIGGTNNATLKIIQENKYIVIEQPSNDNLNIIGFDTVRRDVSSALESDLNKHKDLWSKLAEV